MANPPQWQALEIQIPGKDVLKNVRELLETLVIFLDIAKTLLNVVKTFLQAIGNPIKALAKAIVLLIASLIETLRRTGLYAWFNFPNLRQDPKMLRISGGYTGFVQRFKGSLLDAKDLNRPQPIPGFMTGGFVLIVADVQGGPTKIISLIKILRRFFASNIPAPQYNSPVNLRVNPARNGFALISIAAATRDVFKGGKPPDSVLLRWDSDLSEPQTDPDGTPEGRVASQAVGALASIRQEFMPTNWLIERSTKPINEEVTGFDKPGLLFLESKTEARGRDGQQKTERSLVMDEFGQPAIIMEDYYTVETGKSILQSLSGGPRYLDETVKNDTFYYYRIRAYTGELKIQGTKIKWSKTDLQPDPRTAGRFELVYPGTDVVMGQASPIIRAMLPTIPADFDVEENVRRLFLLAYAFNFHLPTPVGKQVMVLQDNKLVPATDAGGYPIYTPIFDPDGNPTPPATDVLVGQGSISALSGILSGEFVPSTVNLTELGSAGPNKPKTSDGNTGDTVPWTSFLVRAQAAHNTSVYLDLLLSASVGLVETFRDLMQGPIPFPAYTQESLKQTTSVIKDAKTLEGLVFALTEVEPIYAPNADHEKDSPIRFTTSLDVSKTYSTAFYDRNVRKSVLVGVEFLKALGYQGRQPDWVRVSLAELIPFTTQILYKLLQKVQAILDAFEDLFDEIVRFIELIERKINALERFIKFLVMILNIIEQLSAGFYFLYASGLTGGVGEWASAIDSAQGEKPKSTADGGYTAGLCLAYLAPDITAIEAALKAIF